MAQSTSEYYKSNPEARKRRLKQQAKYDKTKKGKNMRVAANKANRALGTYGNGDGKDAAHTGPNRAKLQSPSSNRALPRKGKKYSSGKGRNIA
jgi:hypothetical protein|tara:strand:+ start:670 stop:948 length:279 start_codon:yes stop_codon:yes gene_type:complete